MDSNQISCKIVCFSGKTLSISVDKNWTILELKEKLKEELDTEGELKLIYNGRVVLKENETVLSVVNANASPTFYVNFSDVHGGCHQVCKD